MATAAIRHPLAVLSSYFTPPKWILFKKIKKRERNHSEENQCRAFCQLMTDQVFASMLIQLGGMHKTFCRSKHHRKAHKVSFSAAAVDVKEAPNCSRDNTLPKKCALISNCERVRQKGEARTREGRGREKCGKCSMNGVKHVNEEARDFISGITIKMSH